MYGLPILRSEDPRFLKGEARYLENIAIDGALRAVFVRSMMPHAALSGVDVTEARAKATQVQIPPDILTNPEAFQKFQEAQGVLTGALSKLLSITENYPDLKSNQNFLALQSQLEGTENRIAIARRDYIASVQAYNTEIKTIPGRWWRAFLYPDAQPMQNFTVAEETTKVPEVKF